MEGNAMPKLPPKVDATADLYVCLIDADVACGVRGDCTRCAIAQAIKRCVGRDNVHVEIYRSRALVLMPVDAKTIRANGERAKMLKPGDMALHRFQVDATLSKQILAFDATGQADTTGYRFRAITQSQRLDAYRGKHTNDGSRPYLQRTRSPWTRERGPFTKPRAA